MAPSEQDWQQQADEIVALASILDQDFSLTAGPTVSGNTEEDVAALTAAEPYSRQLQFTAAVHVVLPSSKILIKVQTALLAQATATARSVCIPCIKLHVKML